MLPGGLLSCYISVFHNTFDCYCLLRLTAESSGAVAGPLRNCHIRGVHLLLMILASLRCRLLGHRRQERIKKQLSRDLRGGIS
jgi:hypothetical protein